jgi:hypothetical protein
VGCGLVGDSILLLGFMGFLISSRFCKYLLGSSSCIT